MKKNKQHPLVKYKHSKPCKVVHMEPGEDPKGKLTEVSRKVYTGVGGVRKHSRDRFGSMKRICDIL